MDNKTNAEVAAQIKEATDTAIETKANEVVETTAAALEAKSVEINESLTKSNEEATAKAELLQNK